MIDLRIKQSWLEKSSDTALEEFKSALADYLNDLPFDRHTEKRWHITKVSEGDAAHLVYDESPLASLIIKEKELHIKANSEDMPRYDDVMYTIRLVANRLLLAVYSTRHNGARLPQSHRLSIDHSFFIRDKAIREFFEQSNFVPRFAPEGVEDVGDGRQVFVVYSPYYCENKEDGSIHIINNYMLEFLKKKDDKQTNREFSYKVADSMQDFARKYDLGLVPTSFYQNYGQTTKIINDTHFDVANIKRKVFIDPYVWDFDDEHDYRYYDNVKNGVHLMDKVRKGENLDTAIKRVLKEELKVADDYVGVRIWGIEFDRDRESQLTPRLKVNVFVHGMAQKKKSEDHDWVTLK